MTEIRFVISNVVLLHNNVSYSHPFEYYNVTTCNVTIAGINSLFDISGLHSYQTLARNLRDELVNMMISNIGFALKIFRQTTVLQNGTGMSRVRVPCAMPMLLLLQHLLQFLCLEWAPSEY